MGRLTVGSIGIADLIDSLRKNAWLVPSFQRDFVWSEADVTGLIMSVIEARPIGMATLWEQPDDSDLTLEPASIPDTVNGVSVDVTIAEDLDARPNKFFAVLDGRQRATALAMAFGGLRASDARRKFSGRFYLDVTHEDPTERVRYIRDAEIRANGYDQLSACIGKGLFPLATNSHRGLMGQWMDYIQAIKEPANYPNGVLPDDGELERRNHVLRQAFEGINETVLAVYVVPAEYTLGDICEIFETLNTTGTKVSTVDLLHSWLYNDTSEDPEPILLRDWIDDLGQREGAVGWASRSNRPEIIAQAVTASYVALDTDKPTSRAIGAKKRSTTVSSMKAGDLLATPAEFWRSVVADPDSLAEYFGGFQTSVSGGRFPLADCPYPVTVAMYVGLRWYMDHDSRFADQWTLGELNGLFRAFFWRNSLTGRYDQGFLSQSATDMRQLKDMLFRRAKATSANDWAAEGNEFLEKQLNMHTPRLEDIQRSLLGAKPAGALGRALALPVRTRPVLDLLDPGVSIQFPTSKPVELHHLFPLAWCNNNRHGRLEEVLDPNKADFDYAKSVANLTPLTRESNNAWRAKAPGQALKESAVSFEIASARLDSHYIDEAAFMVLTSPAPDPQQFWEIRSATIATDLHARCSVHL